MNKKAMRAKNEHRHFYSPNEIFILPAIHNSIHLNFDKPNGMGLCH